MSSSNIIILQSSDGQTFEVEEAVALKSQTIKFMIEEYRFYSPFPDVTIKVLPIVDVSSTILSMVIEYCKKHVDTPAEDLKSFDSDFVKVDQGILFDLILAAKSLGIKSLLDVAYEAVADMIKGKTTEEIRMTFNIQNDFTPEEEEQEVYKSISRMTAGASECGQKQDSLDNLQTSKRMRMSEYIVSSSHQKEIMIRLPVAAVVECRRVSKAWKSLIDSLEFITAHSRHSHTHSRHLIVTNYAPSDWAEFDDLCLSSYCDDESFPLMQPAYLTAPSTLEQLLEVTLVGCSHGLVCLRGYVRNINMQKAMQKAVIWNPSIGKAISVDLPGSYSMCVGFGVCPVTCDPKLLWLKYGGNSAEWWTYSSGTWRPITMLPEGEGRWSLTVTTKYSIYSRAIHNKIVSFHLTHESFQVTDLPDGVTSLRDGDYSSYYMSKIEESLALIVSKGPICGRGTSFDVWLLNEDGVQRSFTKLFNITSPSKYDRILARSSNGMLTMLQFNADDDELDADFDYVGEYEAPRLVAYKLESGHTNADGLLTYDVEALTKLLEIGDFTFFSEVHACEESLLLLDCHNTD